MSLTLHSRFRRRLLDSEQCLPTCLQDYGFGLHARVRLLRADCEHGHSGWPAGRLIAWLAVVLPLLPMAQLAEMLCLKLPTSLEEEKRKRISDGADRVLWRIRLEGEGDWASYINVGLASKPCPLKKEGEEKEYSKGSSWRSREIKQKEDSFWHYDDKLTGKWMRGNKLRSTWPLLWAVAWERIALLLLLLLLI